MHQYVPYNIEHSSQDIKCVLSDFALKISRFKRRSLWVRLTKSHEREKSPKPVDGEEEEICRPSIPTDQSQLGNSPIPTTRPFRFHISWYAGKSPTTRSTAAMIPMAVTGHATPEEYGICSMCE